MDSMVCSMMNMFVFVDIGLNFLALCYLFFGLLLYYVDYNIFSLVFIGVDGETN